MDISQYFINICLFRKLKILFYFLFFPSISYAQCSAPDTLNIFTVSDQFTIVIWQEVEGASIYSLSYQEAGTTNSTLINTDKNYVSLEGLLNNTPYEFQLQVTCSEEVDNSPMITQTIQYLLEEEDCSPPTNVLATLLETDIGLISWDEVPAAESYIVKVSIDTLLSTTTFSTDVPYFTLFAPLPSVLYTIEVAAICEGNTTAFSIPYQPIFSINDNCDNPMEVATENITATSVTLTWEVATIDEFIFLITQENTLTGDVKISTIVTDIFSQDITGLSPNTPYRFGVQSICNSGGVSPAAFKTVSTTKIKAMVADLDIAFIGQDTAQLIRNDKYVDNGDNQAYFLLESPSVLENTKITKITTLQGSIPINDNQPTIADLEHGQVVVHPNKGTSKGMINYIPNRTREYDYLEYELTYEDHFQIEPDTASTLICPEDSLCNKAIVLDILTMVENLDNISTLHVWPVPAKDKVYITYPNQQTQAIRYCLYNSVGQKVQEKTYAIFPQQLTIDISDLEQGVYYGQLIVNHQAVFFKVIK